MPLPILSLRPFIGAKDFNLSRRFYCDLGFDEIPLEKGLHLFQNGHFAFYLQDAIIKDWIENSMLFAEVETADSLWQFDSARNLEKAYPRVRIKPVVHRPCVR